ncbi:hypothetical protein SAMN02745248_01456 [Hathewaya proteolytica DSM 3090]|uniref:Uncharacterized protein n=1 Tax=Hathewaya proteolytica DSM 3090 TaxID=1121331 RepID=A0A1M6NMP2_9CLOT|nr:DUF6809 family protein [Hathewaya proteolytica]SHJ96978.1 hypothetical protein SAMN02745248_01456 [Hathewaya proteolytica DSM 3090]
MGLIEDLFNNATSFTEGFGYPSDREWRMLNEESEELILRLDNLLNNEEKLLFKNILEIRLRMSGLELDRMFVYGFRMGARLIADIYNEY